MSEFKGTPGPWRWELNKKSKNLNLCGHGECGPYDYTVMDFERWGMGGAIPRFRDLTNGFMVKAFEYGEIVPERKHHKDWFQSLSHPDAQLIAAAPELLEALQLLLAAYQSDGKDDFYNKDPEQTAIAAINKALSK